MKQTFIILTCFTMLICSVACSGAQGPLAWPVACVPGLSCLETKDSGIGYPDIGTNQETFQCRAPAYRGHTGTDIYVASVDDGVPVMASADGQVMWVSDGKFDRCPDRNQPDCQPGITSICSGAAGSWGPNVSLSCTGNACDCLWGFNAGNFVLLRHDGIKGIAFTLYAHLKKGSISVSRGHTVHQGDQIARVGSSGNALQPHLHFGVWRTMVGSIELANPWGDRCSGDQRHALWFSDPPFLANLPSVAGHQNTPENMSKWCTDPNHAIVQ